MYLLVVLEPLLLLLWRLMWQQLWLMPKCNWLIVLF
jgi:hypothetical protein